MVRLGSVLADPDLYARAPAQFAEASATLEATQAALGAAEEQWLALEMLRRGRGRVIGVEVETVPVAFQGSVVVDGP